MTKGFVLVLFLTCFWSFGQENRGECTEELWNGIPLYKEVDTPAVPKSGRNALIKIIGTNLTVEDNRVRILGQVDIKIIFEFVIDSTGSVIYQAIAEKNPYISIEKTLFDTMKALEWAPAKCNGLSVNSLLRFSLLVQID